MKIIKYISLVLVLVIGITQCKLPDNVNPKAPSEVPIPTLFTNAQVALVNQVDDVNVNRNTVRLIVQYWQQTTYFDESRYLFQDRQIPDNYVTEFYRDAMMDFKRTKDLLSDPNYGGDAMEQANMIAIAEVLEVYAWHCVVDAFGDMPYTEALMGAENSTPVYDNAEDIYTDIINRLTIAIGMMKTDAGSFGGADVMYHGDVASWKKFANSLKLRLGMRIADYDAGASEKAVTEAASGVFTSQDESGYLFYIGVTPHVNAIYNAFVTDNRKDYLPTNTIIDLMKSLNDPRLPYLFTQVEVDTVGTMDYVGAVAGLDGAQSYFNFSNFTDRFFEPTFEAIMIDYIEVEFLLAEAAERYGMGDAETHYNNAVTASILYWGGSQDDADAYLAMEDVAYGTAPGDWKQKIGTQKYMALYNRGVEGWAEWRRLDYPVINIPEGMTYNDIPKRMPYPYNEKNRNKANYDAAVANLGGPDDHRQRIFWDKY